MDLDQRRKSQQKAERALLGWHACQERERSSKLSYLHQRVQLQRDLIAKSDLLTEALRDKHDSQRRKDNESKKKLRREQIEAVRARQKRIQKNRQRTMETLEVKEKEEEGEEEGEALYMVPLGERDEEGSGSQLEFMAKLSGVDATPSSTSDTSSSKSSNGAAPRTANPKLNQLMKACKGNVAIETMWNKLKRDNQRKASHLEQKCLSLRDGEMSPFLKECMVTFDLPYTRQSKFIWDDIRCKQQTGRETRRRHSFPPIDEPMPPASTSEGRRLVNLMFYAALENKYNASEMLARKQFRHSVTEGSVSHLIPEDALKPIGALVRQLREKERVHLECRGSTKQPARTMFITSASTEEEEEVVDACVRRASIFVASNEATNSCKVGEGGQAHLPIITEEPVGATLTLPSPKEGCVRTWSSQSVKRHGTALSTREKSEVVGKSQQKDRQWEPLNWSALAENKQLRVCEPKSSSLGERGYRHGAPKLWKVTV